jgi:hypothetical protein
MVLVHIIYYKQMIKIKPLLFEHLCERRKTFELVHIEVPRGTLLKIGNEYGNDFVTRRVVASKRYKNMRECGYNKIVTRCTEYK